jgi:hypothetical protein
MRPVLWQISISIFLILVAITAWQKYQNTKLRKKLEPN